MSLKLLIILFLVGFIVYKAGRFLYKILYFLAGGRPPYSQQTFNGKNYRNGTANGQPDKRRAPNSNLNIEYIPDDKNKDKKDFRGGEYVDYEEVK